MTELKNDRYLRALLKQPVDYAPVWMMRRAGRLPTRIQSDTEAGADDFMSLCKNAVASVRSHPAAAKTLPIAMQPSLVL